LCEWLCRQGVREPQLHEILIAAGEACANAVEHSGAQGSLAGPAAWIEASFDQATVRIVVADRGVWKEPDPAGALGGRRGRGRLLMAKLMDQTAIRTGPTGTTVQLVKKLADTNGRGDQDEVRR
jgi:anti-sigma regulatory factor (Ser/Thr protein kinase)